MHGKLLLSIRMKINFLFLPVFAASGSVNILNQMKGINTIRQVSFLTISIGNIGNGNNLP